LIYFLIPVFNEKDNIPNLFRELVGVLPGEERYFVFYDDGSTDISGEEIRRCFSGLDFVILGDGINHGPGFAFNKGFQWVIEHSASAEDCIITLEADCTSDLRILPQMIAFSRAGYSLVLASVYAQGGGFDKTWFFRKVISSVANSLFRIVFDIKVLTLSSFYRCYSIQLLKEIGKKYKDRFIAEPGFICMVEILLKAIYCGGNIIEVPVVLFSAKRIGKSKMKFTETSLAYFKFLIQFRINNK
jgi:glycosyltransferase involved in cell wall biosynthesis